MASAPPMVVNRFFETPLIRARWAPLSDEDAIARARELADAFTVAVPDAPPHRWHGVLERLAAGTVGYCPGAFWAVLLADEPTSLTLEDPRLPMTAMYAPDLGFRAPDGGPAEDGEHRVVLEAGEAAMIPAWLRHGVDRPLRRIALHVRSA